MLLEEALLDAIRTGGRKIISVSVRSGKTQLLSRWAPAWYLGRHPDRHVILGSHEADFAASHGRFARDVLTEWGPTLFGVSVSQASAAAGRWDTTAGGGMFTVGVGGAPIGRGGDLVVIDDPLKNFEDAMSARARDRVKDWWAGTMRSRLQPGAAVVVIASRWHEDDLSGWLMAEYPDEWDEIRIPALCDDPAGDPLGRAEGEALWPEAGWTVAEYERARAETTARFGEMVWLAQYQQRAVRPGGGMFTAGSWRFAEPGEVPAGLRTVRGWDLASTAGGGDWTVGALVGVDDTSGEVWVLDVVRGQWDPAQVLARLRATAELDGRGVPVCVPQDPGQAGKAQVEELKRVLRGRRVIVDPQSGSKEMRAWGLSARQQAGLVVVVRGGWAAGLREEFEGFPTGRHDDQVDAVASAFNAAVGQGARGGLRSN